MRRLIATAIICLFALVHYAGAVPLEPKIPEVQVDDTCAHSVEFVAAIKGGNTDGSKESSSDESDCFVDCVHALPTIKVSLVDCLPVHGNVISPQLSDQFLDSHRPPPKLV